MEERIREIEKLALEEIEKAQSSRDVEALRIRYLGRKGRITQLLKDMINISQEDRPRIGKMANQVKLKVTGQLEGKSKSLSKTEKEKTPSKTDETWAGYRVELGHKHPITQVIDQINDIFIGLGFRVVEGPEIETEYYNFEALNIPLEHPSRDVFDTFYLKDDILLRSQTSTVQIRIMEKQEPPLKVIAPGKVFRPDAVDASHSFMFHQVEGLMVDRQMFGAKTKTRFRPHFFPFTEPSAEVDVSCIICGGKGCRVCSQKGWLEILGAGMVNPKVFEAVGYNPEKWTGYAFGMGVERIAMLKYGISDIRLFFENDLRFLRQF